MKYKLKLTTNFYNCLQQYNKIKRVALLYMKHTILKLTLEQIIILVGASHCFWNTTRVVQCYCVANSCEFIKFCRYYTSFITTVFSAICWAIIENHMGYNGLEELACYNRLKGIMVLYWISGVRGYIWLGSYMGS